MSLHGGRWGYRTDKWTPRKEGGREGSGHRGRRSLVIPGAGGARAPGHPGGAKGPHVPGDGHVLTQELGMEEEEPWDAGAGFPGCWSLPGSSRVRFGNSGRGEIKNKGNLRYVVGPGCRGRGYGLHPDTGNGERRVIFGKPWRQRMSLLPPPSHHQPC